MAELTLTGGRQLALVARDIKLSHSVFALPFAVLAVFLTGRGLTAGGLAGRLAIVVACMVFARTWAMLVNRLADAGIDSENPRTAKRVFASGAMTRGQGWRWALGSGAMFVGAASLFGVCFGNWWPAVLAAPVLAWIAFYSYTKRFTWLCHMVLGTALAASPVAAAIAVDPAAVGLWNLGAGESTGVVHGSVNWAIWWIAGMVVCWVAGFDVIYALQDVEFDRGRGLFSVPASLGVERSLWISRVLHVGAAGCLVMAWRSDPRLGAAFGGAVVLAAGLLVLEHVVLARRGKAGLDMAFFTINGVVSVVVGLMGCVDVVAG